MRIRPDVCRAILLTSLVFFVIDVLILFYTLDSSSSSPSSSNVIRAQRLTIQSTDKPNEEPDEPVNTEVQKELNALLRDTNFDSTGPGSSGNGVEIDSDKEAQMKEMFKQNQFNLMASNLIAVNRTLPDYRSGQCVINAQNYDTSSLPKVSIIIVFHNEAWTTLLRTLYSIYYRSPLEIIEEIILVDDLSDRDYLKKPLDLFLKRFPIKNTIIHLPERSGLIRARLAGSEKSTGEVLLFLDAHVEVTEGWLPPLITRVKEDRKRVVAPIIDVISDDNFEYITASETTWGGFNWHLNFRWYNVPEREMQRRNYDRSSPIRTPTIAGGLFAVDKQFFYDIGSYDQGMQVWGGENLEISFRVWMCGGSLEIHPCSRVGHVFRKQTPYTFPGGTAKVIHHNAARTALVWMDEYKHFFFNMVPAAKQVDAGDVSDRLKLRKALQCKSFRWYLENIYPDAPIPINFLHIGPISNAPNKQCIDTMGRKSGQQAGVSPCHGIGGNQAWSLTSDGLIRSDELCLSAASSFTSAAQVKLEKCSSVATPDRHRFIYDKSLKTISSVSLNTCIALNGNGLAFKSCNANDLSQQWTFINNALGA